MSVTQRKRDGSETHTVTACDRCYKLLDFWRDAGFDAGQRDTRATIAWAVVTIGALILGVATIALLANARQS